jgi:hypothetical protein
MKTHITIENLDRVKGINLQDRYGVDWFLDNVQNSKEVYRFHFKNKHKGNRILELKRDMHDVSCWKLSSYNNFDLVSMKTLKDPALMVVTFSNLLS